MFFVLAFSNAAMFVLETGLAAVLSAPFLIAGPVAFIAAAIEDSKLDSGLDEPIAAANTFGPILYQ